MVFRAKKPFCSDTDLYPEAERCLLHYGHRSMFANPRLTELIQLHTVLRPREGGVHLNARTEAWKGSFVGLSLAASTSWQCQVTLDATQPEQTPPELVMDRHISDVVDAIDKCLHGKTYQAGENCVLPRRGEDLSTDPEN
eukprot:TRINITY_DN17340_c0_g2_i1.p2 TRINITY_DN17340_c0_g2~~TRINITY_DN17340_c0_g2_i1.p2  ORF type:complete len:140 (-),score=22.25 TRINITY_DN17340_c0_g2_i1:216-635(-)